MLKRPEHHIGDIIKLLPQSYEWTSPELVSGQGEFARRVEAEVKYEGYLKRQEHRAADQRRNRGKLIPADMAYESIAGLSSEGREKFMRIRPDDLGQAANIPGVTPADIAVLLVHLKRLDNGLQAHNSPSQD
jgi:tRNA uridine 5-carboxymethylaminomethyl modification enzyme